MFGPEDDLTNRFAAMARLPFLPVIAADRKFQPVYVRDLAQAIALAALDPQPHGGKTYEIGGPQVMTHARASPLDPRADRASDPRSCAAGPRRRRLALRFGWLPGAPLTRDQWLMLQRDNVPSGGPPGLDAFGIQPTPLGAVGYEWLGRFRRGGKFAGRRVNLTAAN